MLKTFALALGLLTLTAGGHAEEFKDVPKGHWAAESVKKLADAGVVRGYPDGAFKGDKQVTRYELAVALDGMIRFIQASFQPVKKSNPNALVNPAESLKSQGFIPKDSPLLKDQAKAITPEELSAALASVSAKLIEMRVPPAEQEK